MNRTYLLAALFAYVSLGSFPRDESEGSLVKGTSAEIFSVSPASEWDRVLENVALSGDVYVPAGETWLIGANVRISGNLRTDAGTIALRPGSSLHFVGADPDRFVGGGMGYEPAFANDFGLWIGREGVLDIQGTPKVGWNRTGSDLSWKATDELWISPTAVGDYTPRRWRRGDPIPQIHPLVPAAEVINVTRDILIEGPGHIHVHSGKPQRIEYVTLRNMGVSNLAHRGPVLGRYALHFHHGGNGTRGTVIRGVAAIGSQGSVFVPHQSHGITFTDNVSVNSYGDAFWWDIGDRTNDIVIDRLAVSGVNMPRRVSGRTSHHSAVVLGGGTGLEIRNSAVSGARGSSISHGFSWPSAADNFGPAIWKFSEGNVAHNSAGSGIRLWFNNPDNHVIANAITYRHGEAGVENGAYRNSHRYQNILAVNDHITQHASAQSHRHDGGPASFTGIRVINSRGPALSIGSLRLQPTIPTEFVDCDLQPAPGSPKVSLGAEVVAHRFVAVFRRCGITPDDVRIRTPYSAGLAGSRIVIEHENGTNWEITLDMVNSQKIVRVLPDE